MRGTGSFESKTHGSLISHEPHPTVVAGAPVKHQESTAVISARYAPAVEREGCAVFGPLHYESNYAYPLFVWLHGPGDDESQLKRIMPLASMRNYVAVAPRGTRHVRTSGGRPAFIWPQTEPDIGLADERVLAAIRAAMRKYNIHEKRVFLAGFDCGGTMAYRVAMRHPNRFAGVLSLGGAFPTGHAPLNRLAEARRLALFIASGRDSGKYPPEHVCARPAALPFRGHGRLPPAIPLRPGAGPPDAGGRGPLDHGTGRRDAVGSAHGRS